MHRFLITASLLLPTSLFAAGSPDPEPPTPTETTMECSNGQVWSENDGACVNPQSGALDDDTLYNAARELAYAGQYPETLHILAQMSDSQDDRVLTYMGFVHRKMGDADLGNAYYQQAIAKNPDNLLARSYMGQGFVDAGRIDLAWNELTEIRLRGGRETWAETALRTAIDDGQAASY